MPSYFKESPLSAHRSSACCLPWKWYKLSLGLRISQSPFYGLFLSSQVSKAHFSFHIISYRFFMDTDFPTIKRERGYTCYSELLAIVMETFPLKGYSLHLDYRVQTHSNSTQQFAHFAQANHSCYRHFSP